MKYARGAGPNLGNVTHPPGILEMLVVAHVTIFVLATTWAFGGQADWLIQPLAWWGSLGGLITLTAMQDREAWDKGLMRPLRWLWPLAAFNAIVLLASLNPSFREMQRDGELLLVNAGGIPWLPSSARPALALQSLWLFDAIWISAFNLGFVVRQRRLLRLVLLIAVGNAFILSVFGTVQKLSHARGLFFDAVPSPQKLFFASFVYHNHWGAFAVLLMAACLGLIWHYARRREARDFFHTPAFGGVVILLVIAVTVPLSTSRSSTLLAVGLLAAGSIHALVRAIRKRRRFNESILPPLLGAGATLVLATAAVWFVARESIVARYTLTQNQLAEMRARGTVGDRVLLYQNTWRMAKDKPWFGWGMSSYPHVFTLYHTRVAADRLPIFYHDAHSDWLQALAEHGATGTALLALAATVPLWRIRRRQLASPLPAYLLGGCALLVLYATVEFPFGNTAVVLSWWVGFFCAVGYARLQDREPAAEPSAVAAPPGGGGAVPT